MAIASLCACANGASSTDPYSGFTGSGGSVGVEGGAGGNAASSGDSAASDDATMSGEAADDTSSASGDGASDDGPSSPPSADDGGAMSADDGGAMTSDAAQASTDAAGATDALAPADASDKCAPFGNTCGNCTQGRSGYECGWCNGCFTGTSSGPASRGACAGAKWVWNSSNCP